MWHAVFIEEMKGSSGKKNGCEKAGLAAQIGRPETPVSAQFCVLCLVAFYSFKPLNSFPVVFYGSNWQFKGSKSGRSLIKGSPSNPPFEVGRGDSTGL
jgi:hypothetical protein